MSLSSQKTALLRSDKPAAQDPPVGVEDHGQLPVAGLSPRTAGEVKSPGLSHFPDCKISPSRDFNFPSRHFTFRILDYSAVQVGTERFRDTHFS